MPRFSLLLALLFVSTTLAAQNADLALSVKIASTPFHTIPTRLEMTVTNHGPSFATNVIVTSVEALDDRLDGRCRRLAGNPQFRCTSSDPLFPGQSLTFTAATGTHSTIRPMTFRMTATADQTDPLLANNAQTVVVDWIDERSAAIAIAPPPSLDANRIGTARRETQVFFLAWATWGRLRFDAATNVSRTYYVPFPVTHGGDAGAGSLRQAIADANAACTDRLRACRIELGVDGAIRPLAPLPVITAEWIAIDRGGKAHIDGSAVAGDGLRITGDRAEIRDLRISGFRDHGLLIDPRTPADPAAWQGSYDIERCVIRVGGRGVMIMAGEVRLLDNDLSGNGRSGAFIWTRRLTARGNRFTGNGASGIFVGPRPGGFGPATIEDNTIENNGEFGIALAPDSITIVGKNRIAHNVHGGIDLGLDGPSLGTTAAGLPIAAAPVIESARFDGTVTVIEAVAPAGGAPSGAVSNATTIDFYANDAADPEAEQFLGTATLANQRFRLVVQGDLRGKWITAVAQHRRVFFGGEYSDQVSSELSRAFPVN